MSNTLTPTQVQTFNQLSADERYDAFIKAVTEGGPVWSLSSDEGWAIISDEDTEYLPVWPNSELANTWATDGYADCAPKAIEKIDWIEKWLPGMIEDGLQIAVCPDIEGEGIVISAEEVFETLEPMHK